MKMEETDCSETSTQNSDFGESLKRKNTTCITWRKFEIKKNEHILSVCLLWRWKRQIVPKRRHKIQTSGIAQEKEYYMHNMAEVWNQEERTHSVRSSPTKMEETDCSETSTQNPDFGESLKRKNTTCITWRKFEINKKEHILSVCLLWRWKRRSVPKRRQKIQASGIAQEKEHDIYNMTEVWNQEV